MESLNDRLVAMREAESYTARLAALQHEFAQKLRRVAARICDAAEDYESPREMSAIGAIGVQAGTLLSKSADYVERVDPGMIKADVTRKVQHCPGASLLIAGTVGFIASLMLRRR